MPLLRCKDCLALHAGSIARTCAATGVGLHLIGPLGFPIDSSRLKRAGLDYWPYVAVNVYSTWQVSLGACGPTLVKGMTRHWHLSHTLLSAKGVNLPLAVRVFRHMQNCQSLSLSFWYVVLPIQMCRPCSRSAAARTLSAQPGQ